ncbi:MAG TPA: PEP-CTERM sorting domain-containing protein [Bryobacteraceae bacterium]|nr:PEP-CTERM sorting domain-containing protein [Bryobacteraceae bacterium]HUO29318.1 PEP-CTERM sorting domain-containing protein [Bryobacteraceae bacterium]
MKALKPRAFGLAFALLGAVGVWTPSLRADVITFDDLTFSSLDEAIPNGYSGLNWSNFGVINTADAFSEIGANGYTNGTVSGTNVAFNENGTAAAVSDGDFTFNSAYFTAAWNTGLTITVVGKEGGVTVDTTSFVVNTTGPTLETFNWTGIDELDFSSSGGTNAGYNGSGTQFAMDNMSINSVPEPSTLPLVVAALIGAAVLVKSRRFAHRQS